MEGKHTPVEVFPTIKRTIENGFIVRRGLRFNYDLIAACGTERNALEIKNALESAPALLEQVEKLKKENKDLNAKCSYQQSIIDRKNGEPPTQIQMIDNLKRILDLQFSLRKIIAKYNEYSESVDEIPNQWFIEACEIAEIALEKSTKIDPESEFRAEVEKLKAREKELIEALEGFCSWFEDDSSIGDRHEKAQSLLSRIKQTT